MRKNVSNALAYWEKKFYGTGPTKTSPIRFSFSATNFSSCGQNQ